MRIDLASVDVFKENELDLDRRITFIFGKNGTGKSTITNEIRKLSQAYDVSVFQGFSNIIDENKRLNAVVLGAENSEINRRIDEKKAELEKKQLEKETIEKSLREPEDESISNYWSKKKEAEKEYKDKNKEIDDFFSKAASDIKQIDTPSVAQPTYNKRSFKEDINGAVLLSQEELEQNIATIKSEVKNVPAINFPTIDFQKLKAETNTLVKKTVIERVKLCRLDNNTEKREFAKKGLDIHKKGEVCAFCGNKIEDNTWDELVNYFSVDEVKKFQKEIQDKIEEIDKISAQIRALSIDVNNFYPALMPQAKEIKWELEKEKEKIIVFLNSLRNVLDEKLKYLFEELKEINDEFTTNIVNIEREYENIKNNNNENDFVGKKQGAKNRVRKHYVKQYLDKFDYETKLFELKKLEVTKDLRISEYDSEEKKITGEDGLDVHIKSIQDDIVSLQNETKNEILLAENINNKLRNMVSFELVHVDGEEAKGYYRVKNSSTGYYREITELSTGEKNIIAFLYFIEKLDEVKEASLGNDRIIVFDDPMSSNDDGMQYLIIEELQKMMKRLSTKDFLIILTHNKHFYLNVKYGHKYNKDRFIRFESDGRRTYFKIIDNENEDYKTSYESLWNELKFLFCTDTVSADLLLNPIRRIIETYTKFNGIKQGDFCSPVHGAMKLFNVNSHSIDDVEAELNGKTKKEIVQMFYDCFSGNNQVEHFNKFWGEWPIEEDDDIVSNS